MLPVRSTSVLVPWSDGHPRTKVHAPPVAPLTTSDSVTDVSDVPAAVPSIDSGGSFNSHMDDDGGRSEKSSVSAAAAEPEIEEEVPETFGGQVLDAHGPSSRALPCHGPRA